jgi:hypothetical protein
MCEVAKLQQFSTVTRSRRLKWNLAKNIDGQSAQPHASARENSASAICISASVHWKRKKQPVNVPNEDAAICIATANVRQEEMQTT